jgi:hypothetical protein
MEAPTKVRSRPACAGGELFPTNDVRDNGSPNRSAKRKPDPKHEDASKHRIRVDRSCPRPKSKERCACSLPHNSTYDHNAPVYDVSESAGGQREQEEGHGGGGCHGRAKAPKHQDHSSAMSQPGLGLRRPCPITHSPAISGKTPGSEAQTKSRSISYSSRAASTRALHDAPKICSLAIIKFMPTSRAKLRFRTF